MDAPPQIDQVELQRKLLELEAKLGKKRPVKPLPQASPELWPGKDIYQGDWTIALRNALRERMGMA